MRKHTAVARSKLSNFASSVSLSAQLVVLSVREANIRYWRTETMVLLCIHKICALLTLYLCVYAHKFFDIGQINSEKTIKQAKKLVCVPKQ